MVILEEETASVQPGVDTVLVTVYVPAVLVNKLTAPLTAFKLKPTVNYGLKK